MFEITIYTQHKLVKLGKPDEIQNLYINQLKDSLL